MAELAGGVWESDALRNPRVKSCLMSLLQNPLSEFQPCPDAVPLHEVRRALVIKLRHHGDVLLTSPVFSVLKSAAPHCEIDALVYADTVDMLSLHPAIAQIHTVDRGWKRLGWRGQLVAESALFTTLRGRRYDLIVHLTEHWRGAWLCRLLKPRWAVSCKRSDTGKLWRRSFSHHYPLARALPRHTVENNLDALRRIGVQPSAADRALTLISGCDADEKVSDHLRRLGVSPETYIHIHPASRWFFKCWPVAHMTELIERLHAAGHSVLLTAAPDAQEMAMVESIQSGLSRPAFSLAGQLTLKELAALTRQARLFVGVDSAPMHMAAAVGTSVIALFGPSGDRQWGPWGKDCEVLASEHSCRPCGLDGCGGGKVSDCLTAITVDRVFAAILKRLAV